MIVTNISLFYRNKSYESEVFFLFWIINRFFYLFLLELCMFFYWFCS